ncbi:thermonuclease family protein [Candidatus Persebacteraceae bacterium Df01]|jgi:endonuclease YncB( thermonuclease family)|uniref:Thermonuclease family protein n=1 Tax=Candidatus Doriopsillibacter californiensis TaxID=2970740 RepID=A0ABT7QM98_9GAMM|nr:thermonuclease family protein [Candidatus Persebacteraceae bacterium Df01]
MNNKRYLALIIGMATCAAVTASDQIVIPAILVKDGDTIRAGSGYGAHHVRLCAIDTPEKDQPHGAEATAALAAMLLSGDPLRIVFTGSAAWGRVNGLIIGDDPKYINLQMVKDGHAWAARDIYADDCGQLLPPEVLQAAEDEARAAKRGLWTLPNPIRPSEWRKK